ncbi:MAG: hypothetical protein RI973_71 [Bacteroidota bacterium]|jgi:glucokinase
MELGLGIDIGGTSTKLALADRQGAILGRSSFSTLEQRDEHHFFKALFEAIDGLLLATGAYGRLAGIGAGAPSVNEHEGSIENPANLPFRGKVPFTDILRKHFELPVFLVKDSNASTLGEMRHGTAKGMQDLILLTLGTGLGCGVVTNGRLLCGSMGHAGEAGHICVDKNGRECGCGRRGCLETHASATGLKRTVFELLSHTMTPSSLRSLSFDAMTSKAIFEAAHNGDSIALKAFEHTGEVLGQALADMAAWFEPEAFILSGGLATAGDLLFKPTLESLERHSLSFQKGKIKLLPSALGENDAALLGAASLVWEQSPAKATTD